MNEVMIFVPVNIGRNLESMLHRQAPGLSFVLPGNASRELEYFAAIAAGERPFPQLIATLQGALFKVMSQDMLGKHCQPIPEDLVPLRQELKALYKVPDTQLAPLFVVPIVMVANANLRSIPQAWSDLFHKRFIGRVLAPDADTPVTLALRAILQDSFGVQAKTFLDRLACGGMPLEVAMAVNRGFYDVGIMPLPFTRYRMAGNLHTVWPKDGALGLPEMLLLNKDAGAETLNLARSLLSINVQRFFSLLGGMIPVIEGIPLPRETVQNEMNLLWKGWDWYRQLMSTSPSPPSYQNQN